MSEHEAPARFHYAQSMGWCSSANSAEPRAYSACQYRLAKQRAPELGHAVTLDCPGAIDPKDAVLVAVERYRFAMRLEILAGRLEVVEG